jgi:DNA-binding transcriptional regulator PaaX
MAGKASTSGEPHPTEAWLLLAYRVPTQSSRARVAVWRDLRRLGAFYLQQAVCVLPDRPEVRTSLQSVRDRIDQLGGTSFSAQLTDLDEPERRQIVEGFTAASQKDYAEIVEECQTRFTKEIEFERFRENYTFEEAEEIRQDWEKLRRWFARVVARDWMSASGRAEAEEQIARCEAMLEEFEDEVFQRSGQGG